MGDPLVWLVLLLGAPVGSFMAAFADRLCLGRSIWLPSSCASCGVRLRWRDLIPLFSYPVRRGRCRDCGGRIPARLWLAELLGLLASLVAVAVTQASVDLLALAVVLWCLLGLALCDLACFRLPDALTGLLFVSAVCLAFAEHRLPEALVGAVTGAGVLWLLRFVYRRLRGREGLGLGDVKLAAGLGAALGPMALPWLGLIASASALIGVSTGAWGGVKRHTALPFGLFLCLGAAALLAVRLIR